MSSDELTLPRLLSKKQVLEVVPVSFRNVMVVDAEGRVSGRANGWEPTFLDRERSRRLGQQSANSILQEMKRGDFRCV
jgi:hypothetical protein